MKHFLAGALFGPLGVGTTAAIEESEDKDSADKREREPESQPPVAARRPRRTSGKRASSPLIPPRRR